MQSKNPKFRQVVSVDGQWVDGKMSRYNTATSKATERVKSLKRELDLQLELVVHSRESLQQDMLSSHEASRGVSTEHLKKLKELTACFNTITEARIRLLKAEKQYEETLTPAQEKAAVTEFVKAMEDGERSAWLKEMFKYHFSSYAVTHGIVEQWKQEAFDEMQADLMNDPQLVVKQNDGTYIIPASGD